MFIFRFIFYFTLSFIILSFRISDKPIFIYIDNITHPWVAKIYSKIGTQGKKLVSESKVVPRKFFNTLPKKQDKVKSGRSGLRKRDISPEDDYTPEEKASLNKIFEEASK